MMIHKLMCGLALAVAVTGASSAQAGYVTATYSGSVTRVYDGSAFTLGEPINYSVTFDPGRLVDVTTSVDASLAAHPSRTMVQYASVLAASLSDDPRASLSITIGDQTFDKFAEYNYGTNTGDTTFNLGEGNLPVVEYLNGRFAGIGGSFYDSANHDIELYTDPIGAARGVFGRGHDFYIDNYASHDDYNAGNTSSDAAGTYDIAAATFLPAAVPEAASWAMMIGGVGLVGSAARRRRQSAVAFA